MVTIVIPVYNVSDYIERCIKSVMNQTYSDIECILVDDATPDDSIEKCESLIAEYNGPIKFSIIHHQKNRGLSAARNTGTDAATGEYLYYLDSDDEITSDCIEKLLRIMIDDNSIDMVQGNHIEKKNGHQLVYFKGTSSVKLSSNLEVYKHYFDNHHIVCSAWNKLMKRSFVERFKLYFRDGLLYEDRLWIFYVKKHIENFYISKDITYIYHVRPNSITTQGRNIAIANSFIVLYQDILSHLTPNREKIELNGWIYGFCKPYCMYIDELPMMEDVLKLYKNKAKQYHCWYVYLILNVVGLVLQFGNPMKILSFLHALRWKKAEFPDMLHLRDYVAACFFSHNVR